MPDEFTDFVVLRRTYGLGNEFVERGTVPSGEPYFFDDPDPIPSSGFEYLVSQTTQGGVGIPYNTVSIGIPPYGMLVSSTQYLSFLGLTAPDSYYLLSGPARGTASNILTWTWPAHFGLGDLVAHGLYLERSETSLDMPGENNVYYTSSTTPPADPNWTVIHSWTGFDLKTRPTTYTDSTADTNTAYAYRLSLIASPNGSQANVKVDWNVVLTVPPLTPVVSGSDLTWTLFSNAPGDLRPDYTILQAKFDGDPSYTDVQIVEGTTHSTPIDLTIPGTTIWRLDLYFTNYHWAD